MRNKGIVAGAWILSVVVAAIIGWFTGVSNATRVAVGVTHFMMYFVLFAAVLLLGAGAWLGTRGHHNPGTQS